jgi:hypothetical protein
MSTLTTTTAPGWAAALSPSTTDEAWKVAQALAKSAFVPKQFQNNPSDILIAAAMGARLGLDVFSALQSLAVVNGRPTLYGDALLAVCQARPDWRGMAVRWDGQGDAESVTVSVRRQVAAEALNYDGRFSVGDAKRAGLWTKQGPWSQFPKRMMEMRARSYALRGAFADALLGFHSKEEAEDLVEVVPDSVRSEDAPRRRTRNVAPSIGVLPESVEPVAEQPPQPQTTPAAVDPAQDAAPATTEPPAVDPAAGADAAPAAPPAPTIEEVRKSINYAASSVQGGAKAVVAELVRVIGYPLAKAEDIKSEDRRKAIEIADSLAGL